MNILVLAGGLSPERDVSLTSGSLIANALVRRGHRVLLLDLYAGIEATEPYDALFTDKADHTYKVSEAEPDLDAVRAMYDNHGAMIGKNVIELARFADVVFLALHGAMGENGQLQATLDTHGIEHYTGSGYIGSLLAMDKMLSKRLMEAQGIPTPEWLDYDLENDTPARIAETVGFPCVVKPCACGSSCGVSIVDNEAELAPALEYAKKYGQSVLVERKVTGREFSLGILDGMALPPIEIIPLNGWYDYKNKYQSGSTKEVTPAEISPEETAEMSEWALKVFRCLGLDAYSRIDFLLEEGTNRFYVLEANTLPGMTPTSLMPQEAAVVGIEYDELCDRIAALAAKKKHH